MLKKLLKIVFVSLILALMAIIFSTYFGAYSTKEEFNTSFVGDLQNSEIMLQTKKTPYFYSVYNIDNKIEISKHLSSMGLFKPVTHKINDALSFIKVNSKLVNNEKNESECFICNVIGNTDNLEQHKVRAKEQGLAFSLVAVDPEQIKNANTDPVVLASILNNFANLYGERLKQHPEIKGMLYLDFVVVPNNNGKVLDLGSADLNELNVQSNICDSAKTYCVSTLLSPSGYIGTVPEEIFLELVAQIGQDVAKSFKYLAQPYIKNNNFSKPLVIRTILRINNFEERDYLNDERPTRNSMMI